MVNAAVTILMAVYNPPLGMLNEAMDSILGQTFADFEFLIVDDGSTDQDVIAHLGWRASRDARIRVAWEAHRGLTASLNRGLALASGRFIARQDADDWSAPERLARQLAHFAAHPEDAVCGSNAWTHQQNRRPLWRTNLPQGHADLLAAFPRGNPFVHGSVMFKRAEALAAGGYCETFRCSQDYDFFWRMVERHGAVNLPEPLYHYRYTSGSVSAGRATEQLRAHHAIRLLAEARSKGVSLDSGEALAVATGSQGRVFRALLKQADHLMLAGDYRTAARSYMELLAEHPWSSVAWAKVARLGLFRTMPFLREACFR